MLFFANTKQKVSCLTTQWLPMADPWSRIVLKRDCSEKHAKLSHDIFRKRLRSNKLKNPQEHSLHTFLSFYLEHFRKQLSLYPHNPQQKWGLGSLFFCSLIPFFFAPEVAAFVRFKPTNSFKAHLVAFRKLVLGAVKERLVYVNAICCRVVGKRDRHVVKVAHFLDLLKMRGWRNFEVNHWHEENFSLHLT